MESRLITLEEKVGDIRIDQSAIKENLTTLGKTLGKLADIRAETLHLMKQQAQDRKEHEEIFTRLRVVENGRTACDEKHTAVKTACKVRHVTVDNSIDDLETNQRWCVTLILGAMASYVIKIIFFQ